jgi:malonyl CoA-acyl carrier protein transacylase
VIRISKLKLFLAGLATAVGFSILGAGTAYAVQTHMFAARDALNEAQNQLQQAVPDKGGHRVNAINLVQQAINEVNLGIQFGAQ